MNQNIVKILLIITFLGGTVVNSRLQAQSASKDSLSGIITDAETGKPLVGISVAVDGKSSSITDADGKYALPVPHSHSFIVVSGLGYAKREIAVRARKRIDIVLYESDYKGAQKEVYTSMGDKSSTQLTGAMSVINEDNALSTGTTPDGLMQSYTSGVYTVFRSGMPGSGANMYIHGLNTLHAGSQPLFIVDGLPYENSSVANSLIANNYANPLASIDIKDIQSITVMKDGTGLYGVKGGNGVILIKTFKSQKLETKINAHVHSGISLEAEKLPVLNASEFRGLLSDVIQSQGVSADAMTSLPYFNSTIPVKQKWGYDGNTDYYRYNHDTDWQSQIYDNKMNKDYYLKVSGGDEVAAYVLSIGFLDQKGTLKNTAFQRFHTRFNSSVQLSKSFSLLSNMSFIYGTKNLANEGADTQKNSMLVSLLKSPLTTSHVYSADGLLSPNVEPVDVFGNSNPYALTENVSMENINYRFMGSFEMKWKLNDQFSLSNLFGLNFNKERERIFYPSVGVAYDPVNETAIVNESQHRVERLFSLYNDLYLNYQLPKQDLNSLNIRTGLRYQTNDGENDYGTGYNSSSDNFKSIQYGSSLLRQVGGSLGKWNWLSGYAVADYGYKDKYYVTLSATADATSRAGKDAAPMFVYPSVAGAWLVSGEEALKHAEWLNLLKLRASCGLSGNDDIGNYNGIQYYKPQNILGTYGLVRGNLVNSALKPETVQRLNAGLDLSLWNERLSISADVYSNTTKDLILSNVPERTTGFDVYLNNGGSMRNTGFDLNINARVINHTFKWDVGLNLSSYKNKVLSLNNQTFYTEAAGATIQTKEGQPLGLFYGYKTNGVYSTQAEADKAGLHVMQGLVATQFQAGDVKFVNQNNDNLIDENDRVVIGNPNPDVYGSISNVFKYKQWTLNTLMNYSVGNDVYNYTRSQLENMSTYNNQSKAVLNRWRYEGNVTNMPRATYGDPMGNARFSDRWIEDGSYIRLKMVQLSYELKLSSKYIESATFFATAENLFTLTHYKGFDPEFALGQSALTSGIDACFVAQPKIVSFGVNLSL